MFNQNELKIKSNVRVTKENVLSEITQEELFKRYFNYDVKFNKANYKALHRNDNKGTCYFRYFNDKLRLCDQSSGEFLDIFDLIGRKYSLNFNEVLLKIVSDNNLKVKENPDREKEIVVTQNQNKIKIETRTFKKWLKPHIDYWNGIYNISSITIIREKIYAVETAWITNELGNTKLEYLYSSRDLCFEYKYPDGTSKLYYPQRSKDLPRFKTNSRYVDGWDLLPTTGDLVVITSSKKDRCVLYELGIPSVCTQAESIILTKDKIDYLLNHFDYVIVNPDYDLAGIRMAKKYRDEFGLKSIFITKGKDVSGMVKEVGFEKTKEYVDNLKSKII